MLTCCLQFGRALLVLGSNLKDKLCGLVGCAVNLLTVCFQFGSSVPVLVLTLLTGCFQLGQSVLVLGFSLRANLCGLVACFKFAYSLLPAWSQFLCACI